MRASRRAIRALRASVGAALALCSCQEPFQWHADVRGFVDNGLSVVTLSSFTVNGAGIAPVPSGREARLEALFDNPRSLGIECRVSCVDESLLDALPTAAALGDGRAELRFTPALGAEHRDICLSLVIEVPALGRVFDPMPVSVRCDSPPGPVEGLGAALDSGGRAFAAFRLPSSPTDDDLASVEVRYRRADGSGPELAANVPAGDPSLLAPILSVQGSELLSAGDALNCYFLPPGIDTGDDYLFTVSVIDAAGLRSAPASVESAAETYTLAYDGNGSTGGLAPVDPLRYRHTKPVIASGPGSLYLEGFTFASWNTAADGSGTAYAPGDGLAMPPHDFVLYAQWARSSGIVIAFTLNPDYGAIVFSSAATTVARGTPLELSGSAPGATDWRWYVNDALVPGQTGPGFSWDTASVLPGQYIINAEATLGGIPCTGSIKVTVSY